MLLGIDWEFTNQLSSTHPSVFLHPASMEDLGEQKKGLVVGAQHYFGGARDLGK
jgi:hypothetical protein